jgi:tetratricopeptide (TPR) repeat protein
LAQLGDALVSSGKIERARDVFQQLVDREPESDSAKRKLNDVLRKMGLLEGEIAPQPDHPEIVENLQTELPQAPAPKVRPGLNEEPPQVPTQSPSATPSVPDLDEETQKFIAQSLTDVDLFASYGLTQKAIGLLEAILRRAPMHTPTLEKLLDFVLGAGDDRRTAELAAQLEHIHAQRGDTRSSERFGELRRRFQRAAGLTDDEITAAVAASMPQPVETVPVEQVAEAAVSAEPQEIPIAAAEIAPAPVQPAAHAIEVVEEVSATPELQEEEVDLSSEWASVLEETKEPAAPAHAEPVPEIHAAPVAPAAPAIQEFSLPEFAIEEPAASAPDVVETPAHEHVEAASKPGFTSPAPAPLADEGFNPFAEISAEMPSPETADIHAAGFASHQEEHLLPDEELTALPVPEHSEVAAEGIEPTLEVPQPPVPETPKPSPEFEVDQDFELILEPETVIPPHELLASMPPAAPQEHHDENKQEPVRANGNTFGSDQFLSDLAKEIDQLGMGELTLPPALNEAHMADEQAIANKAKESAAGEPGPLKEVFEEFRAELGEMGAEDEDLETHYNLGVAFREMGLLEEAIGEFQKVAKATDRGKAFRYAMQCSTLLGLAFMEKGQPGIAAIWYERALLTPGIDSESKLALRYDLGVAQESAGDLDSALKSFSQVYAVNIDYRDVAERIASLQKPAR